MKEETIGVGTNKQFVLSKKPFVCDGWKSETLSNGYVLSWHEGLKVEINKENNVCLLGHAWSVTSDNQIITLRGGTDSLLEAEKGWSGRYLLIIGNKIYLDANGLLGVFYDKDTVSSSMNIMFRLRGQKMRYPKIKHGIPLDFIPGEYTELEGVKRLLPSQVLDYTTATTTSRELLPDKDFPDLTIDERNKLLDKYLATSMRNMQKEFSGCQMWLALTGGRDSRTSLAGLVRSGVNFKTFTLETLTIGEGDKKVPEMLSDCLGVEHRFIPLDKRKYSKKRMKDYFMNTAGIAVDADRYHYSYFQYDQLIEDNKPIVVVKSNVYEDAKYYHNHYIKNGNEFSPTELSKVSPLLRCNRAYFNSLSDWYNKSINDKINKEIGIDCLYYWVMRCGCWLSGVEQSLDLYNNVTFAQPVNSRVMLSLLMGYEAEERIKKVHQERFIASICPQIKNVPYDSNFKGKKSQVISKVSERVKKIIWLLRNYKSLSSLKCAIRMVVHK